MDPARAARWSVAGVVCAVLVVSGPAVGTIDLVPARTTGVGGGDATVASASVPADRLAVNRGRFGTGVYYLRLPAAEATVGAVDGRPRLVYVVRVPALGVEHTATRPVEAPGDLRLRARPLALDPAAVPGGTHRAELVLRVQSFDVDRTVRRWNGSIQV